MAVELQSGLLRLRIDLLSHKEIPYIKSLPGVKIQKLTNEYLIMETTKENVPKLEALNTVIVITPLSAIVDDNTVENVLYGPAILYK